MAVKEEFIRSCVDGLDGYRYRRATRTFAGDTRSAVLVAGRIECVDDCGRPVPGFAGEIRVWVLRTQRQTPSRQSDSTAQYSTVSQHWFAIRPVAQTGGSSDSQATWSHEAMQTQVVPVLRREISSRLQRFENELVITKLLRTSDDGGMQTEGVNASAVDQL